MSSSCWLRCCYGSRRLSCCRVAIAFAGSCAVSVLNLTRVSALRTGQWRRRAAAVRGAVRCCSTCVQPGEPADGRHRPEPRLRRCLKPFRRRSCSDSISSAMARPVADSGQHPVNSAAESALQEAQKWIEVSVSTSAGIPPELSGLGLWVCPL